VEGVGVMMRMIMMTGRLVTVIAINAHRKKGGEGGRGKLKDDDDDD